MMPTMYGTVAQAAGIQNIMIYDNGTQNSDFFSPLSLIDKSYARHQSGNGTWGTPPGENGVEFNSGSIVINNNCVSSMFQVYVWFMIDLDGYSKGFESFYEDYDILRIRFRGQANSNTFSSWRHVVNSSMTAANLNNISASTQITTNPSNIPTDANSWSVLPVQLPTFPSSYTDYNLSIPSSGNRYFALGVRAWTGVTFRVRTWIEVTEIEAIQEEDLVNPGFPPPSEF